MKNNIMSGKKLKHGSVSLILTIFIVVSAIILNVAVTMLANNYNWMYIDMTSEQLFTLSNDCIDLLDRSFIKIMENREGMNKELPKTNHGIAEENVKTAEMNVTIAENAIETAKRNLAAARENLLVFEQSVIKARTNVNIAESNLEFAKILEELAEDESFKALAAENIAIAEKNLSIAKENLITAANNAQTAETNAANKKYNDQNALKEGDEGFLPYGEFVSLKDYEEFKSEDKIKAEYGEEFIDFVVYDNIYTAEDNLEIAEKNLTIAKDNLLVAKENETISAQNADKNVIKGDNGYTELKEYAEPLKYMSYIAVSNFTEPSKFEDVKKASAFKNERGLYETDVKVKIIFCDLPDNIKANDSLNLVYETARDLEDRFPEYITVENVDIWNNSTAVQKYKTTSYTSINSTNVIIESGTEFRVCTLRSFFAFDQADPQTPWAYNGEKTFAANIVAVAQAESPIACITVNHGEVFKDFQLLYTLQDAGYKVETIDLAYQEIPEDCRLLVIYDPVEDLMVKDGISDISEVEKIDRFLDGLSCALMVFVDPETPKLANLEEYLEEWGVVINRHTDSLDDTYGSVIKESAAQSLTTDGFTFTGTYVQGGAGGSIYKLLSTNSNPPKIVFKNSTSLSYSEFYTPKYVEPTEDGDAGYECATYNSNGGAYRTIYDVFVTSDGAVSMANGNQVGSGAYKLMTITRENQMVGNDQDHSSVMVCASTEFATEALLASGVYGNSDVVMAASRDFGEEFVPVDLDYKIFASTEISSMTTQSKNLWTTLLTVIPTVLIIGTGIFVLVRRRYS